LPEQWKERYPLDEAISLEARDGTSLGVRERALWAAIELSYEKAASFLKKFIGLEASRQRVFGEAKSLEEKPEKIPKVLYIQVDATGVNDRARKEWMGCKVRASFSNEQEFQKAGSGLWIRRHTLP